MAEPIFLDGLILRTLLSGQLGRILMVLFAMSLIFSWVRGRRFKEPDIPKDVEF